MFVVEAFVVEAFAFGFVFARDSSCRMLVQMSRVALVALVALVVLGGGEGDVEGENEGE